MKQVKEPASNYAKILEIKQANRTRKQSKPKTQYKNTTGQARKLLKNYGEMAKRGQTLRSAPVSPCVLLHDVIPPSSKTHVSLGRPSIGSFRTCGGSFFLKTLCSIVCNELEEALLAPGESHAKNPGAKNQLLVLSPVTAIGSWQV